MLLLVLGALALCHADEEEKDPAQAPAPEEHKETVEEVPSPNSESQP